jgi:hypothetical protein
MKKPLRLMAALLAFCIAAAAFPTVGLAAGGTVHEITGTEDPEAFINSDRVSNGDTIRIATSSATIQHAADTPWVIRKSVIIEGTSQTANIEVGATGILLGADVTFRNVGLSFNMTSRNAIIANGYELTLEDVRCTNASFNLFCGGLEDSNSEGLDMPSRNSRGTLNIGGNTTLQGKDTWGSGNIYAGNLSMGGMKPETSSQNAPPNVFNGDAVINISGSASSTALGSVYACGAQNKNPEAAIPGGQAPATKRTYPDPDNYTISGTVTVTGAAIPDVYGAGSGRTNVEYSGSGNSASKTFQNVSSLSVKTGNLALKNGSSFRDERALSVSSGAKLDLTQLIGQNLDVNSFDSNGYLFLGEDQTWRLDGSVTGKTTVVIDSMRPSDDSFVSVGTPKPGHVYVQAPNSSESSFELLPPANSTDMTLIRDASGNWTASGGSSSGDADLIADFQFITENVSVSPGTEAEFEMGAKLTNGYFAYLDDLLLNVTIDWSTTLTAQEDPSGDYAYIYTDRMGYYSAYVGDNFFCITTSEAGNHTIQVTLPTNATVGGKTLSDTATLTVTDDGTTPNPGPASIPVPTANTGLRWTGAEQTGVNEGTGYTLTGHKGTNAGNYTATATLEPNYQWTDGTDTPKTISWSIAKAAGPAAPNSLAGAAPSAAGRADGEITGTTAAMEYASNASFSGARDCGEGKTSGLAAGTYYVRVKETSTHEAGVYAAITVPVPGAPTLQSISVNSTAHKTEYQVGGSLDVANLTIEAVYSDGSTQTVPVTANMVSGFDSSVAAESQTLTIRYENRTATYTVRITGSQQPGKPTRQVTVGNTGSGGTAAGVYTYEEGADVAIRAGSKDGFAFASWDAAGIALADRNAPDVRFKMPANDVTLNAVWTPNGDTPPAVHTHVWDTAWKNDAACHWHDCAASGCTLADNSQKSGYAAHTAGSWVVDRPATSTQSGTRHRSCTVCGYEMVRESIPATGGGSSSGGGPSSGGGSSSSGGSSGNTTTVQNPDGSSTSTNINKTTGAVTETTKRPDGSKTVVETQKDGTVTTTDTAKDGSTVKTVARPNGTTETTIKQAGGLTATVQESPYGDTATIRIPSQTAEANPGGSVALPVPPLSGANASVTVHTGAAQPIPVEIPIDGNDATTVACLVNEDGSETILKTALLAGGRITVSVPDGATVHIRDNGKNFQDVQGHWAENAISFVAARELFSGEASGAFAPEEPMSRAMLATVLARLDGVDAADGTAYQQGMAWAVAQGISDGQNPDGQVTREQFVVMLHRYAGNPAATNRELYFSDSEKIEAYAREAVLWATENGILNGYEDGSFAPNGSATRAQAAAMLARYVEFLNQR